VTKAADIPEDAVVFTVLEMDAFYLDPDCQYYQPGLNGWVLQFATGDDGVPGYPVPWFLIYTTKEYAISGVYNVARGNIDLESCLINTDGQNFILATDAEIKLQFDGYDEEYFDMGYRYGYYTGSFRLVGEDGKTYIGKFMEEKCNSFTWSSYEIGILSHAGMWDEDPDYTPWGVETVSLQPNADSQKIIRDGQILIVRDGKVYNLFGARVQ